jgi:hypothetical protein
MKFIQTIIAIVGIALFMLGMGLAYIAGIHATLGGIMEDLAFVGLGLAALTIAAALSLFRFVTGA